MAAAPKILTADEAEKLKQKQIDDHNHNHKAGCNHKIEEHHDKIIIIERPREEAK